MLNRLIERVAMGLPAYLERGSYEGNPVASGDRLAAAKAEWSEDRFPTLYRDIPADIRRPLVWDGRLPGGRDVGHLLWEHLTPAIVSEAARQSGKKAVSLAFVVTFFLAILLPVLLAAINASIRHGLFGFGQIAAVVLLVPLGLLAVAMARMASNVRVRSFLAAGSLALLAYPVLFIVEVFSLDGPMPFQRFSYPEWAAEIGVVLPIVAYYVANIVAVIQRLASYIIGPALTFPAAFIAMWTFGFIHTLKGWASETGAPLAMATRDALLLYKAKGDGAREAEYRAYCRQVEDAVGRLKDLPLIAVGNATGTLRARGDMKAPQKGQLMAYDGESIRNHTLVLGDTGSGKTREILKPLFDRIMGAEWGVDHRIGAYVTDGKGTLWKDLEPKARAHGREDIRIIGTGAEHYGVDMLAGMSPLEVATTFKAVAGVVSGSGDDDFWSESASLLILHVASLASVLEQDAETMDSKRCKDWKALRPYSLAGIFLLATNDKALGKAIDRLGALEAEFREEIGKDAEPVEPLHIAIEAIRPSIEWLVFSFGKMANETKSGIVANVNSTLGKLGSAGTLATRFAAGNYAKTIDVDYALNGGIVLVAIGETEFGMAGRIVATWLKQRLFVLAKRRLNTDKDACANTSVAFMGDEYQMLVTTGPDSDTTFWNIARETGVFYVGATQSVAALKQSIGDEATANLLNLFRNKIVLSTGEVETIDYIIKLAGTLPLGFEPDGQFFATQTLREAVHPVKVAGVKARKRAGFLPAWPSLPTPSMGSPSRLDSRFLGNRNLAAEAANAAQQAAFWRSEDKSREALVSGLNWSPKLRHDELRTGQGFAFAMLYRGGIDRADIIDLRTA